MPFSLGYCFIAQILPAPLGLAQMSLLLGLVTLLRVSCPPARSWPVALISHLDLQFITSFPVSKMGSELLEARPWPYLSSQCSKSGWGRARALLGLGRLQEVIVGITGVVDGS